MMMYHCKLGQPVDYCNVVDRPTKKIGANATVSLKWHRTLSAKPIHVMFAVCKYIVWSRKQTQSQQLRIYTSCTQALAIEQLVELDVFYWCGIFAGRHVLSNVGNHRLYVPNQNKQPNQAIKVHRANKNTSNNNSRNASRNKFLTW